MAASGDERGEETIREFGINMYILLYLKWITIRSYYTEHGILFNVMWQPGWEESLLENGYRYIHMAESLCCASETITMLLTGYTPTPNKKF